MERALPQTHERRSAFAEELSTITTLVRRDVKRFVREKSRVVGALLQPLIFWLVIGSGMSSTFVLPGARGVDYLEYFFPGVVVMVVLFTAIFTTMSVIEDRHSGFLQAVLVAPGSRASVVLGKCLGSSTIAFVQGVMFVLLAPLAGYSLAAIDWPLLLAALAFACFGLCALGFAVAWWLDSTAGYHVVMSLLLLPLWILSGAMFPAKGAVLAAVASFDPMSYAVSAVRRALYGGVVPGAAAPSASSVVELAVLFGFALLAAGISVQMCYRRR